MMGKEVKESSQRNAHPSVLFPEIENQSSSDAAKNNHLLAFRRKQLVDRMVLRECVAVYPVILNRDGSGDSVALGESTSW
jgi:hypothetical protein